jgi:hypothetical protein
MIATKQVTRTRNRYEYLKSNMIYYQLVQAGSNRTWLQFKVPNIISSCEYQKEWRTNYNFIISLKQHSTLLKQAWNRTSQYDARTTRLITQMGLFCAFFLKKYEEIQSNIWKSLVFFSSTGSTQVNTEINSLQEERRIKMCHPLFDQMLNWGKMTI